MGSTLHPCLYRRKNTKEDYHGGEKAGVNVAQRAETAMITKGSGCFSRPLFFVARLLGERIRGGPASYGRRFFLDA
jgi:hypothetical protein